MPLLKSLTWMQIYHMNALLEHRPMIMIVSGYTLDRKSSMKTLTKGRGFLNLFVKIPALIRQRRVYLVSGIWLTLRPAPSHYLPFYTIPSSGSAAIEVSTRRLHTVCLGSTDNYTLGKLSRQKNGAGAPSDHPAL